VNAYPGDRRGGIYRVSSRPSPPAGRGEYRRQSRRPALFRESRQSRGYSGRVPISLCPWRYLPRADRTIPAGLTPDRGHHQLRRGNSCRSVDSRSRHICQHRCGRNRHFARGGTGGRRPAFSSGQHRRGVRQRRSRKLNRGGSAGAAQSLFSQQSRRGSVGPQLLDDVRVSGDGDEGQQYLWTEPIPREVHSALHHERARWGAAPALWRRTLPSRLVVRV